MEAIKVNCLAGLEQHCRMKHMQGERAEGNSFSTRMWKEWADTLDAILGHDSTYCWETVSEQMKRTGRFSQEDHVPVTDPTPFAVIQRA